jgi:hypothetical protein
MSICPRQKTFYTKLDQAADGDARFRVQQVQPVQQGIDAGRARRHQSLGQSGRAVVVLPLVAGLFVRGAALTQIGVAGTLATVLWLTSLRRAAIEVRFLAFLKVGCSAMPAALLACLAYLALL